MGTSEPDHTGWRKSSTCWNAMYAFGPLTIAQWALPFVTPPVSSA